MLGRHVQAKAQGFQQLDDADVIRQRVGRRVDPDHRVARTHQQPIEGGNEDALRRIGRMIRLVAGGETPWQAEGRTEARHHRPLGGDGDEILETAELRDRGHHLRRQAGRQGREHPRVRLRREQPFPKGADRQGRDWREGLAIVPPGDEIRYLILLGGDQFLFEEGLEGEVGERDLRGEPFHRPLCGDARELVARPFRRRLGEQALEIRKAEARAFDGSCIRHEGVSPEPRGILAVCREER